MNIRFEKYEGSVKEIGTFRKEFTSVQLGKIVEIGLEMIRKQDKMIGKQDLMVEK
ncbi:MAG: hypothetical protein ACUVTL_10470 [Thermoproteota archaeon]